MNIRYNIFAEDEPLVLRFPRLANNNRRKRGSTPLLLVTPACSSASDGYLGKLRSSAMFSVL